MNSIAKTLSFVVCGAALAAPRAARADDSESPTSYAWYDSSLQSGIGVSTILGGGITGFTDKTMRDVSSTVGGLWDLRATIGTHIPIGLDITYLGTAANINALTNSQSGTLVGTTVEGALRYNMLPHYVWNPYVFAGIGWQRYDVTGATVRLSDSGLNSSDNSVVYPLGAGLSYRDPTGLVVDVRGTFRANTGYGLVLESPTSSSFAPMHSWEASAAAGYEF